MKKIVFLSLALAIILGGCSVKDFFKAGEADKILTVDEAQAEALKFINENLMNPGSEANITEISDEGSIYKIMVDIGSGEDIESYISKDGKKFFPQVFDIEKITQEVAAQKAAAEAAATQEAMELEKKDKPEVELFVMSHCPYGTQIEKGILPVLNLLGDKIDFDLKFCDYAMHGKTELDEQLNQYCIQKNEPEKLIPYLTCFLAEGDGQGCLSDIGINTSDLSSCVSATDQEFKVTEGYNDKSTWKGGTYPAFNVFATDNLKYGVQGSPSMVVNGKVVSSGRDSASLLATICAGFNTAPEECGETLSDTSPSAGFGFNDGAATQASCN